MFQPMYFTVADIAARNLLIKKEGNDYSVKVGDLGDLALKLFDNSRNGKIREWRTNFRWPQVRQEMGIISICSPSIVGCTRSH